MQRMSTTATRVNYTMAQAQPNATNLQPSVFACQYCVQCFNYESELEQHMRELHQCDQCPGQIFPTARDMVVHLKTAHVGPPTTTISAAHPQEVEIWENLAPSVIEISDDDDDGQGGHRSDRDNAIVQYRCQQCTKIFKRYSAFKTHICGAVVQSATLEVIDGTQMKVTTTTGTQPQPQHHHQQQQVQVQQQQQQQHQSQVQVQVQQQQQQVPQQQQQQQSMRDPRTRGSGPDSRVCPHCGKNCGTSTRLAAHLRTHTGEKPFGCEKCSKAFATKSELVQHVRGVHDRLRPFECPECKGRFGSKQYLNEHITLHSGERPYQCKECTKSFKQARSLRAHIRGVHKKIKPFQCDQCSTRCYSQYDLNRHMNTHTGEKPFKCDLCPQRFTVEFNLRKHVQTCHEGDGEFVCSHCGARFHKKSGLSMHLHCHTGTKPHKCTMCTKSYANKYILANHMKAVHHVGKTFLLVPQPVASIILPITISPGEKANFAIAPAVDLGSQDTQTNSVSV